MNLTQSQRQSQVLSPQQRQGLNMLQMTHLELRAELQNQMAVNPVIEDVTSRMEQSLSSQLPEEHVSGEVSERELDLSPDGTAAQTILNCDDGDRDYFLQNLENYTVTGDSGLHDPDAQSRRQTFFDRQVRDETLQEHLQKQVALSDIAPGKYDLADMLIEQIDDDGYFKGSVADIQMLTGASEEEIFEMLMMISSFDPQGCGGRDLRECLLYQMETLDDSPWENEVRLLIDKHLDDVAAKRISDVCRSIGVEEADFPKVLSELKRLDPVPGRGFTPKSDSSIYVKPEVFVRKDKSGKWVVEVENRDLPEIHISKRYLTMLEDDSVSAEAKSYIKERVRAAESLIQSIDERQRTIYNIAKEIVEVQSIVFDTNNMAQMRPLTMEQVAQKTGVHNATVSRTVRNKYMATPLGLIEMRKFFTSGLQTESGAEVSNIAVKDEIRKLVESEDKSAPLSDESISKLLSGLGIKCARRTVAKYRESLGIPGTTERRVR